MSSFLVVIEPGVGLSTAEFVAAWGADEQAAEAGPVSVEEAVPGQFGPEILEWIAVPFAVNLASNVVYDLVKRVVARVRAGRVERSPEIEYVRATTASGDEVVVVRVSRGA
ncbi:hypothetical protein AB0K14_29105 [Actinosynnema sp. NPDC050801]|uniref:hypothetical protein n=1 Tax=unclassified Actinosynnema TaxID=2637065 RepID=UPI0033D5E101